MKITTLAPGTIIQSKSTDRYGIITVVDYTNKHDRFPYFDILWEDGRTSEGFFIMWLLNDKYDNLIFTNHFVSTDDMHRLNKENVKEIIDSTISKGE